MSGAFVSGALVPVDGEWRRLSPRMLLVHPVIELGKALPAIIGVFLAGHSSGDGGGSRWGLGIAGVVMVFSVLRWFTTRYRITPDQVQLRRGLLRRETLTTPLDRVRTVDVTAHLLHRVLGLARVIVGTGTSDRKGRGRLVLDGLGADAAAALRADLLHRRAPAPQSSDERHQPAGAGAYATEQLVEQELARVEPGWLRYAPFTLTGALTGLALLGLLWRVVNEGRVNLRTLKPYRVVADQLAQWPVGVDIAAVLACVIVFIALASTAGYVLSFWQFRLTRHSGGTLHVSRGLFTSRATSIERRRLIGAELSEPLLLRSVGGARCLAIATGLRVGRGAERGGEILLPPAPVADATRVAGAVLDTDAPFSAALLPHPRAARRRRMMRALAGALTLAIALAILVGWASWPGWLLYGALAPFAVALWLAGDRYRGLGHALVDGFVVTRFGSVVRRRCAVDATGVIGWNLRSSFFQRRMGLTTLVATTAAGRQRYVIEDVAGWEAVRFADSAKPGLLTEFLRPRGDDPAESLQGLTVGDGEDHWVTVAIE
jgi:putative membrane protein